MLLACLSEKKITKKISGIFLLATPFWKGSEEWVEAFKLRTDFATQLDPNTPLFFYHCSDDEEVPFDHMSIYKRQLPWAHFQQIPTGGHQLNNDLTVVATDVKSL